MSRSRRKISPSNGLKCIDRGIHCPATNDGGGSNDELEQIQVNHFLNTLARIALSVASRELSQDEG